MTRKKLQFFGSVGEKIDAIADPSSSLKEIARYLATQASTEEQWEALSALELASDREAACICIPKLQRAFMLKHGLDGWPQKFGR